MPETEFVIHSPKKPGKHPHVQVTTFRNERKYNEPDRSTSWDVTETGELRHKNARYYVCSVCNILWRLILGAVGIYMIIIGAFYLHQCPMQGKIPIYLIVGGIVILPIVAVALYMRNDRPDKGLEGIWKLVATLVCSPVLLFLLAWNIAGIVWTYGSIPLVNLSDVNSPHYCNSLLFISSAVCIVTNLALISVLIYLSVVYFRRGVRKGIRRN